MNAATQTGGPTATKRGALIVARHGERIDYVLRNSNRNWVTSASRPWDPPLTSRGRMQGRELGTYLSELLSEKGLEPVAAVYSSPMVRCCQTAAEAVTGLTGGSDGTGGGNACPSLKVTVEPGLVESLNENWYRSWCLADSNGSWGGPEDISGDVDPRAKLPIHALVWGPHEIADFLTDELSSAQLPTTASEEFVENKNLAARIDTNEPMGKTGTVYPLQDQPYRYGTFESPESTQDRMEQVAQVLSARHPNQTVLLVSHGGPVTHVYERLTGDKQEGMATYTSFSVYRPKEDGGGSGGGAWEAIVSNESCHVKDIESVDHNSSFV